MRRVYEEVRKGYFNDRFGYEFGRHQSVWSPINRAV